MPPTIVRSDEETVVEAIQNSTAYMDCETEGIPPPTVLWLKDMVPLLDFPYETMRQMNGGKRLELHNVQVDKGIRILKCPLDRVGGQVKQDESFPV